MNIKFPLTAIALACLLAGCDSEDDSTSSSSSSSTAIISLDSTTTVDEPISGKTIKTINVNFSNQASKGGSYNISVDSGTAIENVDFSIPTTFIEFNKGDSKSSFDIEIFSDGIYEDDEDFVISLTDVKGIELSSSKIKSEVTIRDSESEPVLAFSSITSSVSEGTLNYELDVSISSLSEKEISIPFTISGMAIKDSDYTLLNDEQVVVLAPKESTAHISLNIIGDSVPEGGESLIFTLGQPSIGELGEQSEHTIQILGELGLNDTGSFTFYDGQSFKASSGSNQYPGQDAEFGADAQGNSNTDGDFGFSYSKIDRAGNAMAYTASEHECVRDERTGLVWEVKHSPQPLPSSGITEIIKVIAESWEEGGEQLYKSSFANFRASNYRYYYYNADSSTNNGQPGVNYSSSLGFSNSRFSINQLAAFPNHLSSGYSTKTRMPNSDTYINYLNEVSHCGFNDFRLPTLKELRSIHNHGAGNNLDSYGFFPNYSGAMYMSDTQSLNSTGVIWCLESDTGKAEHCLKNSATQIRAVRGIKL